jgi:hypothetical protein
MLPAKGGNDPLPLPLRLRLRWSFPPFECQEGNWARIEIDLHWISNNRPCCTVPFEIMGNERRVAAAGRK